MCLFFQCYLEMLKGTALFNGSQPSPALPSEKKMVFKCRSIWSICAMITDGED